MTTHTDPTIEEGFRLADDTPLAIACYGTLRPGFGNSRLWRGRAEVLADDGEVEGYALYGRGFPYAVPTLGAVSVVSLIVPHAEHYDDVLAEMDYLEGVPHHYDRQMVAVRMGLNEYVVAWMYVPAGRYATSSYPVPTDALGRYDWALTR